jgi:hypothetical protein
MLVGLSRAAKLPEGFRNVDEDNIRILFTGLFEAVQHQNEALESLRAAIEKLARNIEPNRDTLAR